MNRVLTLFLGLLLAAPAANAQRLAGNQRLANDVRAEFRHAWKGYKKYAWGHDDLRPLSKSYHDWYGQSLLMTPVDALDTMIIMGMNHDARDTREYIARNLSFDKDISVQNFEITIRLLGGLLSSYQLSGDKRLLVLAEDLGNRLLPAFESPTGLPYRFVNLKTGKVSGNVTNPAEAGTLLIEFGTLSKLTGKRIFYDKAKGALSEIYNRRSPIGLVGTWINVESGEWTDTDSHISGAIDSYYEYLLKCWLLFGDEDCHRMWQQSIAAINKYLADEIRRPPGPGLPPQPELWYGHADMNTGKRTVTTYGALDAFFPAVLVLAGDFPRARDLQASSFNMWNKVGIEPEEFDYRTMEIVSAGYPLRPEIIESTYYLYDNYKAEETKMRRTNRRGRHDLEATLAANTADLYMTAAQSMFADFVKYCRTKEGYAALKSVVTKEQSDSMQSFLFAETFKYFYLLFASRGRVNLKTDVFNTEAHPIRRTW